MLVLHNIKLTKHVSALETWFLLIYFYYHLFKVHPSCESILTDYNFPEHMTTGNYM